MACDFSELLTPCFKHLLGERTRFGRNGVTREHSGNLVDAFAASNDANTGMNLILADCLFDDEVMIGLGRDGCEMGDGQDLLALPHLTKTFAYLLRHLATNAGVHFVKYGDDVFM